MSATYTKLKDESWGIRVLGGKPSPGQTITVRKKSGETKEERVEAVLWSGTDRDTGKPVHLCKVATSGGGQDRREGNDRKCSSCGCSPSALRHPYEKMLTTRSHGVICSPCWSDVKAGYDD